MATSTLILNHLLPRDTVELGRLVLNVQSPEQDYYQPESLSISEDDVSTQRLEDFTNVFYQTKSSRLHGFLSNILSASFTVRGGSMADINSVLCVTHQLKNSEDLFEMVCELQPARKWLERAIRRGRDVYLVTGFKTLTDARVRRGVGTLAGVGGAIRVPGTLAATAAGIIIPIPDALDVGAGISRSEQFIEGEDFFAPGEQVFAVQYRKIKFARFSSRDIGNAYPEKRNRWKIYLGARGGGEEADDIVEAEVHESLRECDLNGPCESFLVGEEEVLHPF